MIVLKSISDLEKATQEFFKYLEDTFDLNRAKLLSSGVCLAFYGTMGVGKTTFIKSICRELEVIDVVNSPTFSIVNEYHTVNEEIIYHFDFYRIESQSEAFDFGYEEYFFSENLCMIEWPEKIENLLPENCFRVNINEETDGTRTITVRKI